MSIHPALEACRLGQDAYAHVGEMGTQIPLVGFRRVSAETTEVPSSAEVTEDDCCDSGDGAVPFL
jgi:hypothetical protein